MVLWKKILSGVALTALVAGGFFYWRTSSSGGDGGPDAPEFKFVEKPCAPGLSTEACSAARLEQLLDAFAKANPNVRSTALAVITPKWQWQGAKGTASTGGPAMAADTPFRIASVTKPYTAAAILRLMELGQIDITDPIEGLISPESLAALKADGYDTSAVRVRDLLDHTSGIYDYATNESFFEAVSANPMHNWTRAEQIEFAMKQGKPVGAPGAEYSYSDTGYILLGEIVERATGKNLGAAVRELLRFERLGLKHTWWEILEPNPEGVQIAANWLGERDFSAANVSYDLYGGGGIVSTVGDLAIFYKALIEGRVFDQPRTLAVLMSQKPAKRTEEEDNTYAVFLTKVGPYICWGHGGFWGQEVAHCPEIDATFAWTVNQAQLRMGPGFYEALAPIMATK
jgi:D-alanyl-D-alanine carboxypeptidase